MQDKTKFIFLGIIALLVIGGFVFINQLNNKINILIQEKDALTREKEMLTTKVAELTQETKRLDEQNATLTKDLERVSQEKDELQGQFNALTAEAEELKKQVVNLNAQLAEKNKEKDKEEDASGSSFRSSQSASDEVYWATVLKKKTDLELRLDNLQAEVKTLKIANEQFKVDKNNLTLELTNITREYDDLKRQFDYNQKMLDAVTQELAREKNDKYQIQKTLLLIKTENKMLRQQLKVLSERKVSLDNKVAKLQDNNASLEKSLTNMETFVKEKVLQMDSLKKELDNRQAGKDEEDNKETTVASAAASGQGAIKAPSSVQLPPILVKSQDENAASKAKKQEKLIGNVLAVNSLGGFIIINLGEEAGVKVGDLFAIYRNGKLIGNVEVIQIRQKISACDIKKEISPIEIGDIVK